MTKAHELAPLFQPCVQKNHIYASDYPALEYMKFVCTVNVYASGTVNCH